MYITSIRNIMIEIRKNPKSLQNFRPWAKGIITNEGDLYMMDYDYTKGDIMHTDLAKWLCSNGNIKSKEPISISSDNLFNFIHVIRSGESNDVILSDSYSCYMRDRFKDDLIEILSKFVEINRGLGYDI